MKTPTSQIDDDEKFRVKDTRKYASDLIPNPVSSTLHRWISHPKGIRGIHLRAVRIGGWWYTSRRWLQEFIDACSASRDQAHRPGRPPVVDQLADAAGRELERIGA